MKPPEDKAELIFGEAARRPAGPERHAYLDSACAGDTALRRRLEDLLEAHEDPTGFLETEDGPMSGLSRLGGKAAKVIGRYELIEKLGEGGFGEVFLAYQREPVARSVALKIIKPGMDSRQVVARFEAERQALAVMDHPSIAKVFDAGTTEAGYPYFVMELVHGERITDYCDRERLSVPQRLELMIQICRAVQHAHQKGIIHRDLKPSNILVTANDGIALPKVIDFGIAKTLQGPLGGETAFTRPEQFVGTPACMSPEQAKMAGQDIDTRSDIYSLGVLLYELLTGQTPFDTKGLMAGGIDEMRRAIQQREPPRPSTRIAMLSLAEQEKAAASRQTEQSKIKRLVSGDLDWIVMKCLEKDRSRRYETANGLAVDLSRHLGQEPVLARPPSDFYRFRKLVQRQKLAFVATAAVLASLLIGLGVSTWLWRQERSAHWRAVGAELTTSQALGQAVAAVKETKATLASSDFLEGCRLAEAGHHADALAYLARSISENPTNRAAAIRLITLLAYSSWVRPMGTFKHTETITNARFSPDGKRVVVGFAEGTACVWELESGKQIELPFPQSSGVIGTWFSLDGSCFLTAASDQTVRVWDMNTGQPRTEPLKHGGAALAAAFSPDGGKFVTGSADHTARVWSSETGKLLADLLMHQAAVRDVQFSPDGERIVTASEDSTAWVWDARSGRNLVGPLRHGSWVNMARFSPDGGRIATASADHTARVWDAKSGKELTGPLSHGHSVLSVGFSPNGRLLVTASLDGTARVWDASTGAQPIPALEHGGPVVMAEFSPDGERVLTASGDRTAQLWDVRTGRRVAEPLRHRTAVRAAHFSADGLLLLTGAGQTVRVWGEPGFPALPVRMKDGIFTQKARFSPDGDRLVTASADLTARIFDARTGEPLGQPMAHAGLVNSAQFSPDAQLILTASMDHTARLWNARDGSPVGQPLEHQGQVNSAEFSPDGRMIVTASNDATGRIWDTHTGGVLTDPLRHDGYVVCARFSPDNRRVLTYSGDGTARIWDARTGRAIGQLMHHSQQVNWAEFSPDGSRVVTASSDGTARVWDAATGRAITGAISHGLQVLCCQFTLDGRRVITSCADGKIRIWDVRSGRPLAEPFSQGCLSYPRLAPDEHLLSSAGSDGWLRLVDAETLQPVSAPLEQQGSVGSTAFSPNGRRIAGTGNGVWVWDVPLGEGRCPVWLGLLAEAVSGEVLDQQSVLMESGRDPVQLIEQIRNKLVDGDAEDDWAVWGRWFLAPVKKRFVSPHSKLTLAEYVQGRVAVGGRAALAEAQRLAIGSPELLALIPARTEPIGADQPSAVGLQDMSGPGQTIYDGALRNGWENYSWCDADFSGAGPGRPGTNSISIRAGPWQALYLHHAPFNPTNYDRLSFWVNGGQSDKQLVLQGTLRQVAQPYVPVTIPGKVWTQVVQPLRTLHLSGEPGFDGFWVQDATGTSQGEFYISRIELLSPVKPVEGATAIGAVSDPSHQIGAQVTTAERKP